MAALTVDIKAIIGLGNPGEKYSRTRHNAGFWFLDELVSSHSAAFLNEKKFHGEVAKMMTSSSDIWCLKPNTYMNQSGVSVKCLASFYRLKPENLLVVHDEIDLEPGDVKLKSGGGHGGHNGLRDIINQLGSRDFYRLRIGVGHPGSKDQVVDYVLRQPSKSDNQAIEDAIQEAMRMMPDLLSGDLEKAMQDLHTKG